MVGRYLRLDFNGRPHRLYFEEAGQGIPLLCLHTAGADGRQYREVLNDPAITARFRVIAFDLPWHGKSSPPAGFETEAYQLTTQLYVDTVMAVSRALSLARPVVMGCSIGGRAVLHLALRHGAHFRAAIGLQSATHAEPGADTRLRDLGVLYRPDIHGQEAAAGTVACLIAPTSPRADKWETLWHYMQGGPSVFLGDLHYYFSDGDLRNADLAGLDGKCPLYLLTGEYDLSATPELTAALARVTGARHFEVMKGMGHFPMSESPAEFRRYLMPVLDRIAATLGLALLDDTSVGIDRDLARHALGPRRHRIARDVGFPRAVVLPRHLLHAITFGLNPIARQRLGVGIAAAIGRGRRRRRDGRRGHGGGRRQGAGRHGLRHAAAIADRARRILRQRRRRQGHDQRGQ